MNTATPPVTTPSHIPGWTSRHCDGRPGIEYFTDGIAFAWTGWRDLPVLPVLPVLASSMPEEKKQRDRWLEAAQAAYPDGWIESGGPVRTARSRIGSRHVPGRTPFHGYDLGAIVADGDYLTHRFKPGLYEPTLTDQLDTQETP